VARATAIAESDQERPPPIQARRTGRGDHQRNSHPYLLGDLLPEEEPGEQGGEHDLQGQQQGSGGGRKGGEAQNRSAGAMTPPEMMAPARQRRLRRTEWARESSSLVSRPGFLASKAVESESKPRAQVEDPGQREGAYLAEQPFPQRHHEGETDRRSEGKCRAAQIAPCLHLSYA